MEKRKGFLSILIPALTVFISSACIMIIELVASRLIARHLGSSLYTWTSVIGIVLAGISVGNYLGGRIADKYNPKKVLGILFGLASIACLITIILNNLVGEWLWLWKLNWPLRVFSHVSIVFLFPSVILGTISPVVAKSALDRGLPAGRTVGDIYAFATAGSIAGTFLAGFLLISLMGTTNILWTIAGILMLMGLLYSPKAKFLYLLVCIYFASAAMGMLPYETLNESGQNFGLREKFNENIVYEKETPYCYVAVQKLDKNPNHLAFMQDKLKHSEILLNEPASLQYYYTKIFAAVTAGRVPLNESPNFMVIGGGGYVFPRYLKENWPASNVDVVEIDPGVTEAAHAAFGLDRDTPIKTITLDARNYVDTLLQQEQFGHEIRKYDVIYEDAINDFFVPFQLVTREFNEKIVRILKNDGIYLLNLIDTFEHGYFMGSIVHTLQQTFPHVRVATELGSPHDMRNTYVVICSMQPFDLSKLIRDNPLEKVDVWAFSDTEMGRITAKNNVTTLTDDYAPVERLLTPVVHISANDSLGRKYLDEALKCRTQQDFEKSIHFYQLAISANERNSLKGYNEIGTLYAMQGNLEEAAKALQKAIDYNNSLEYKGKVGSIHFNIGTILLQLSRKEEASEQFHMAVDEFNREATLSPSPIVYSRLGNAYAALHNFDAAAKAFVNAIKLDATNLDHYRNLVQALELQHKYDDAIYVLQQQIQMMEYYKLDTSKIKEKIGYLKFKKSEARQNIHN
jgi:tetratricopeptide (TPR) repeat protein